jgi:hypothetical protein
MIFLLYAYPKQIINIVQNIIKYIEIRVLTSLNLKQL